MCPSELYTPPPPPPPPFPPPPPPPKKKKLAPPLIHVNLNASVMSHPQRATLLYN